MPEIQIADVKILLTFITSGVLNDEDLKRPSFLKTAKLLNVQLSASPAPTAEIDEGEKPKIKRNVCFGVEVDLEELRMMRQSRCMSVDQRIVKGHPSFSSQVKRRMEEDASNSLEKFETSRVKKEKLDYEYQKVLNQNGCRFCSRNFVTRLAKEYHEDECKQNPDKPLIVCTLCKKGGPYTRKLFLEKHIKNKHPNSPEN